MKKVLVVAVGLAAVIASLAGVVYAAEKSADSEKVLRHVVIFKFKDGATKEQITTVEKAFAELPKKIDTIVGFEWGTNVSKENLNQGFTHCFLLTFKSEADRDGYISSPAHKEFGKSLQGVLEKAFVVDFWNK